MAADSSSTGVNGIWRYHCWWLLGLMCTELVNIKGKVAWEKMSHSRKMRRESWAWVQNKKMPSINLSQRSDLVFSYQKISFRIPMMGLHRRWPYMFFINLLTLLFAFTFHFRSSAQYPFSPTTFSSAFDLSS